MMIARVSGSEFTELFRQNRPAIIENALSDWQTERWSPQHLAARAIIQTDGAKHIHVMKQSIPLVLPELMAHLAVPEWIRSMSPEINLWLGGRTLTPLQFDRTNNFLAQLHGRKQFAIFAPQDTEYLYPCSQDAAMSHLAHVDPDQPDLKKYRKFRKAAAYRFELQAGEMLFLPAFWWHQVRSPDVAVSVSFSWPPQIEQVLESPNSVLGLHKMYEDDRLEEFKRTWLHSHNLDFLTAANLLLEKKQAWAACILALAAFDELVNRSDQTAGSIRPRGCSLADLSRELQDICASISTNKTLLSQHKRTVAKIPSLATRAGEIEEGRITHREIAQLVSTVSTLSQMDLNWMSTSNARRAPGGSLGRRDFVSGAVAGVLAGPMLALRISPASAQATCAPLPDFPADIPLSQQAFQNWSREIQAAALWTCAPRNPADVLRIVNWASLHGYKVRARGKMHNWSPLAVSSGTMCSENVLLLDTTQFLTAVSINTAASTVTAQTGTTMEALLRALENAGLGVTATPAPGELTLGGVLAIDGHGTSIPARGEQRAPGHTYGSVSNLILSLTAVVWDSASSQYVLKTFQRTDPQSRAFLAHLGRSFITEVTLRVGANQRLRCQSWFDIPATELFAPAGSAGRTFTSYLDNAGRVEAIWFPFTSNPWLKVWSVAPSKPLLAREVTSPYNYAFSDTAPQEVTDLFAQILNGNPSAATQLGPLQYNIVAAGLVVTFTYDIWGWSKNLLLYIRPSTLRVTANGYAVLMNRSNVQRALNEFTTFYQNRVAAYQSSGQYPMNGPVEIRVTGLDHAADVMRDGAGAGQLSALRPRPDHPDWDVAVWFDILTVPGTPEANRFYREIEQWMLSNYSGSYAMVRPEWSKGWGYTDNAAWADPTVLTATLPAAYRAGQPLNDNWDTARATLDEYDPNRVFSSPLLERMFP